MWSKISKRKLNTSLIIGAILCGLLLGFNAHSSKMPRKKSVLIELSFISQNLIKINENLNNLLKDCNCSNSESICVRKDNACVTVGNYKSPCENPLEIEIQRAKLQKSIHQLALLTRLAKTEDSSLYQESQKIFNIATSTMKQVKKCSGPDACNGTCFPVPAKELCGSLGVTRRQVPFKLNFGVELKMEDVTISPVEISEVGLRLPESIATPDVPALSNIEIEIPDIIIDGFEVNAGALAHAKTPESALSIEAKDYGSSPILDVNSISTPLPSLPSFNLTCDNSGANNISHCSVPSDMDTTIEDDGISKFNDVSQKCKNLFTTEENIFYTKSNPSYDFKGDQFGIMVNAELSGDPYFDDQISLSLLEEKSGEVCKGDYEVSSSVSLSDILNNINQELDCPNYIKTQVKDNQFIAESTTAQEGMVELKNEITINASVSRGGPTSTLVIDSETTKMVPGGCFNPDQVFDTISNRCNDLKASSPSPPACNLNEDNYDFSEEQKIENENISCGGETITNSPNQPWCNDSIPSIPKIELPDFPGYEIELPDFVLFPLIDIQLPDFIIEELKTPDIELCNLNECQDIAPDITFNPQFPKIAAPIIEIPQFTAPKAQIQVQLPDVEGGGTAYIDVKMPEVRTTSFKAPSINLGNLQAPGLDNLFSFAEPKLNVPQIDIPTPQINYYFEGPSLEITPGLIIGTLLNVFNIDPTQYSFSFCLDIPGLGLLDQLDLPFIELVYEDYIFSWPAFPEIPELDFCSDINQFCATSTQKLEGMKEKIKKIEETIETLGQDTLGEKLEELSGVLSQKLEEKIEEKIGLLEDSLSQEIIITEDQYAKLETEGTIKIPSQRINTPNITIDELKIEKNYPEEIPIPWDTIDPDLQSMVLTDPIKYEISDIPLSILSWKKDVEINLPFLQEIDVEAKITTGENQGCIRLDPRSSMDCSLNQKTNELKNIQQNL